MNVQNQNMDTKRSEKGGALLETIAQEMLHIMIFILLFVMMNLYHSNLAYAAFDPCVNYDIQENAENQDLLSRFMNTSGEFHKENGEVCSYYISHEAFSNGLKRGINYGYRGCSLAEYTGSIGVRTIGSDLSKHTVNMELLNFLGERQLAIDRFVTANLPVIVGQGTTASDAVYQVYRYVEDYLEYDMDALENDEMRKQYQGAYMGIQNHKGVCATYAKLFRCLIEGLPIENGIVNYEAENYGRIEVAYCINENATHAFNGIRDQNGDWHFFDACWGDGGKDIYYDFFEGIDDSHRIGDWSENVIG